MANFERPRMNANSLLASPTGLSPYLRFGCLSCRLYYFKLTDLYKKVKRTALFLLTFKVLFIIVITDRRIKRYSLNSFLSFQSQVMENGVPPLSLYGQVLWREFFYTAATNNPHFDKMEINPICVQIPWDRNPEALAKWAEGRTGFLWIDPVEAGRVDPPSSQACCCLLPHAWRSVDQLGRRPEGTAILDFSKRPIVIALESILTLCVLFF